MTGQYSEELDNEEATLAFGARLARATFLNGNESATERDSSTATAGQASLGGTIYLQGDLGAGKTTLTRGILRGFGFEGAVKSPTYTLVEPYEFELCNIYHFDLYRLADAEEVSYLGAEDYFQDDNLCIVEWPEKGLDFLPSADLIIQLQGAGTARHLSCQTKSEKGKTIAKRLWGSGRS
ncbi:MAG: tRNA (adenosine(37)-N6)-threonylcarbamoyltransferase complex ATPase subunit type 1 TsaE [Pseudomonadales bacterium]|nr:tRNA (adenosine(37)-N6)-threonylcarbamoyltransferase complex ATPase subunit type 1 TsaE [Pseudomonadales bacterium]